MYGCGYRWTCLQQYRVNIEALQNVTLQIPAQYYPYSARRRRNRGRSHSGTAGPTTHNLTCSATSGKVALVTAAFAANTCGCDKRRRLFAMHSLDNIIDLGGYQMLQETSDAQWVKAERR